MGELTNKRIKIDTNSLQTNRSLPVAVYTYESIKRLGLYPLLPSCLMLTTAERSGGRVAKLEAEGRSSHRRQGDFATKPTASATMPTLTCLLLLALFVSNGFVLVN